MLMKLQAKSLRAYGIDPRNLIINTENRAPIGIHNPKIRSLAKVAKNSRALAIETEHAIMAL